VTRRESQTIRPTRLVAEAVASVGQRPVRSLLTALGTLLGVATFMAIAGLTATTNAQVGSTFNARDATEVSVGFSESSEKFRFEDDAQQRARAINGVAHAAISADPGIEATTVEAALDTAGEGPRAAVQGVTPQYWATVQANVLHGRIPTSEEAFVDPRAAVIGKRAAERLGITDLDEQIALWINGERFSIVAIIDTTVREETAAGSVSIPLNYVRDHMPLTRESMLVTTRLGAAEAVAQQIPAALEPWQPTTVVAKFAPRSKAVQNAVSQDLHNLFLMLAGICLIVGAVGIANVSLIAVMERYHEIGLRRALGALPRHILAQFLIESGLIGLIGGLTGGAVGLLAVVGVSYFQSWTPAIDSWLLMTGPPLGLTVGVLAGLYPAARAARIAPVDAFGRGS
jgi:putative ABC transport system permease protein